MEKKPEVDGKWVEVDFSEIVSRMEELNACEIGVIKNARLEMAGDDMPRFVAKFNEVAAACSDETEGMDDSQKSFYVLRRMVLS